MSKHPSREKYVTSQEVAEMLRVNIWTVKRWLSEGKFQGAYKIGSGKTSPWRIPESAVDEFIRARQKERD